MTYFECPKHGRQLTDAGREHECPTCAIEAAAQRVTRPSKDEWLLAMARLVATRATCARRKVGCVLVDARGHVLATGYNGRPRGFDHCSEGTPCAGATAPSGTDLDACEAVHAEQNALLQCPDVELIDACYVTVTPCVTCVKLLLNTSCRRVVAAAPYPAQEAAARDLWIRGGRHWAVNEIVDPTDPACIFCGHPNSVHKPGSVGCAVDGCTCTAAHSPRPAAV